MKLSVVIPVYNERNTIGQIIKKVMQVPYEKEIIVVDDCSNDGTREFLLGEVKDLDGVRIFLHERNRGKGAAIRTAYRHTTGELIIVQDADMEYDPYDWVNMIAIFKKDSSVGAVYGSRFLGKKKTTPFWHYCINRIITIFANLVYSYKLSDWETCYKMFRFDAIKDIHLESNRFDFEIEITAKLIAKGIKITEVPITYRGRWYHEGKKIKAKDGIEAIFAILRYRFNK